MDSRGNFLKKATLLAATGGLAAILPISIQKAFAINPPLGSTYLDAEYVVILMQENRSFDHVYGCLRGVRGLNDPLAMTLPNGNLVWLQSNAAGETHAPFRLNLLDTKATWIGSLPHGRNDQLMARNGGKHDRWLEAKCSRSKSKKYKDLPLTLGYYNREGLPFYYAGKLKLVNHETIRTLTAMIEDLAYGDKPRTIRLNPSNTAEVIPELIRNFGWHDFRIRGAGAPDYEQCHAGRIEIGQDSFSDPAMGASRWLHEHKEVRQSIIPKIAIFLCGLNHILQ